jgi:hypothetical protein
MMQSPLPALCTISHPIHIFTWSRDEIVPADNRDDDPSLHSIAPASRYRNAPVLAGEADIQLATFCLATDRPGMGMSSLHRSWRSTPSRL